jgi:hypothetical protein
MVRMPVTGGLRQEDCEFEAILPMQGDCLKKKKAKQIVWIAVLLFTEHLLLVLGGHST